LDSEQNVYIVLTIEVAKYLPKSETNSEGLFLFRLLKIVL